MASFFNDEEKHVNKEEILNLAKHFASDLGRNLIPKENRDAFSTNFQPPVSLKYSAKPMKNSEFLMTASRQPIANILHRQLKLRDWRNENKSLNDAQIRGGLGGVILEGSPAAGKSELARAVLEEAGYREINAETILPPGHHKVFYLIPVSMSMPEKEALLLKAFDEGAVVLIDEMNSSSMMERLLNDLSMGIYKGKTARNPGFMIFGTQNPIHMDGRRKPSNALARRLLTVSVPDYTKEEQSQILQYLETNPRIIPQLVETYNQQAAVAEKEHLSPAPTLRELIKVASDYMPKKAKRQLENSKLSISNRLSSFPPVRSDEKPLVRQVKIPKV